MPDSRIVVVLLIGVVVALSGQGLAYHQFDPQNVVYTDSPSPDVLDSVPKVAMADSGGTRYVYAVWWHQTGVNWELSFSRQLGEGSGAWEIRQILATPAMLQVGPEYTDIAVSAYGQKVHVAWTEQVSGAPTSIKVATSTSNGAVGLWTSTTPSPDASYSFFEPDLVETDQYAYLARVRFSASSVARVQFVRLEPSVVTFDVTTNTGSGTFAYTPSLAAYLANVVVAYQYCSATCNKNSNIHVWSRRSTDAGVTWPAAVQVDTGTAATPGGSPDLASHGKQLHIVWQANTQILYERASVQQGQGFGQGWNAATRFTISTTFGTPTAESKFSIAAYGYGVAVVYRPTQTAPPSTRRNNFNGQTTAWLAAESLDASPNLVKEVDVTVDTRHEISGEKGNVVQYVWSRLDGTTNRQDVYHRRIPTDERERQRTTFGDFTQSQGQSAAFDPSANLGYIFGGSVPLLSDKIWRYDPTSDTLPPQDTGHRLLNPVRFTSAIWNPFGTFAGAFIFFGELSTGPTGYVCWYTGASNPACFLATPGPRSGTSAAYDTTRYAYVFGGKDSGGNYLSEVLKFDTSTSSFVGWGACAAPVLPTPMAFSSAAWDSQHNVVFVFGGEKQDPNFPTQATNYYDVLKFDPNASPCPTITTVATIPCPPWELCAQETLSYRPGPGTVALYASALALPVPSILLVGGAHLTGVIGDLPFETRFIYSFDTATYAFTLKLVDLPICKGYGSAIWYVSLSGQGILYYFGGNFDNEAYCDGVATVGGGNQVVRYDINTH